MEVTFGIFPALVNGITAVIVEHLLRASIVPTFGRSAVTGLTGWLAPRPLKFANRLVYSVHCGKLRVIRNGF